MQLPYTPLADAFVKLEPLAERHRDDLRAACNADPRLWTELYPFSMAGEHFEPAWDRFIKQSKDGGWQTYAVLAAGRCVGMSSYLRIDPEQQTLEIGATYYRPEARGGPVNPAAKRLLMGRAFEARCRRVQYCVDAINLRSRAAVTKLGAVQEGIIRQDRMTWTGRIRDTVYFSVLSEEWPAVKAKLDARLAAFTPEPATA